MQRLSNPGNYPFIDTEVVFPASRISAEDAVCAFDNCIARGAGLSISDGALNDAHIVSTRNLNRFVSFDAATGILVAEAGVILADIAAAFVPRGWSLSTVPGTNQITLGGAIASDVHGKNHHTSGSFDRHVLWLDVLTAAQGIVRCSPTQEAELFHATCGGMGLTGLILAGAVQLVRVCGAWIKETGFKTRCLSQTLDLCAELYSYPYLVAWIDPHADGSSMGRGYVMCGEPVDAHAFEGAASRSRASKQGSKSFRVPAFVPVATIDSRVLTQSINMLYTLKGLRGSSGRLICAEAFHSPIQSLDLRLFGGSHVTYQFTVPFLAHEAFRSIFRRIVDSGLGSLISVLKLFGPQPQHPENISFPQRGYNLGIDFRVSRKMFTLFRELDSIVLDYGGRHYLSKDVCLEPKSVRRGYGDKVENFLAVKRKWDPDNRFRSLQSMRLQLY
ncbi:FAD/FMN-containing dehydrogenase [Sphingomonas jatrophae]|uniref:FAD/FMN-containing dehydrogenase n=1 Tax=Sphingomonas jatrophae TaxID=1166337 RepID=A0A1I6M9T7_9SPHN|nr:FAD/FMN-containing dehydrogenase [Sphingomonas jatrophae]